MSTSMMKSNVSVNNSHLTCEVNGIVLASLQTDISLLEDSLLEGILFGKRSLLTEEKVSDSQVSRQISKGNVRIWSFIVTGNSGYSFYDFKGNIDTNKLQELEKKYKKEVVGWWVTKPQGANIMHPSLREFTVQKNLSEYISRKDGWSFISPIFATFQSHMEDSNRTPIHHFKYKFYHSVDSSKKISNNNDDNKCTSSYYDFQPILIKIITGEINSREEYENYTTRSTLPSCPELYDQIEKHFNANVSNCVSNTSINSYQKSETEKMIQRLLNDLNLMCNQSINEKDERELFQLLDEIQHIKNGPKEEVF